jgi:hypothetical protein
VAAADRIAAWLDEGCDALRLLNNDFNGDAVRDAQWLQRDQSVTHH